jgi:outer membrane usher protein FimD/PapC
VFFSEPIQSAYALVKVDGLNDVGVLLNGAEQGNTGRRGGLVIPALSPYTENAVSLRIDGTTNALADVSERMLKPRFNSGIVTSFAVHHVQVFVGTLAVERRGVRFAPSYGVVTIAGPGGAVRSDLGPNGEFYFENLIPGPYRATARYARGETCTFDVHAVQSASLQVDLGALTCVQR